MSVLQLEINDRLVSKMGLESIYQKLQKFLELQELRLLALEIDQQIKESGFDQEKLFRSAKRAAWKKFKADKLKNVLA